MDEDVEVTKWRVSRARTIGVDGDRQRRRSSCKPKRCALDWSAQDGRGAAYPTQTCENDGETEPQARESEDPEPTISRKHKILSYRGKEAGKGNDGSPYKTARGPGSPDVGDRRICKTVQAFLKHRPDLVLDLAEHRRIGVRGQGTARCGKIAIWRAVDGIRGKRGSVERAKDVRRQIEFVRRVGSEERLLRS